jgi:hypothetical protein
VSCRGEACSDNIGGGLFGMNLSVNLVLGLCRSLNCAPSSGLPPDLWDVASLPHPNLANPAVPHGCGWMELEQMVGWRQSLVARVDGAQVWWRVMDGWQRSMGMRRMILGYQWGSYLIRSPTSLSKQYGPPLFGDGVSGAAGLTKHGWTELRGGGG